MTSRKHTHSIGVGTGGGAGGAIPPHFLQEEVNRSTPSTRLMRDVSGGSALRLLSRLPALHSSLA